MFEDVISNYPHSTTLFCLDEKREREREREWTFGQTVCYGNKVETGEWERGGEMVNIGVEEIIACFLDQVVCSYRLTCRALRYNFCFGGHLIISSNFWSLLNSFWAISETNFLFDFVK